MCTCQEEIISRATSHAITRFRFVSQLLYVMDPFSNLVSVMIDENFFSVILSIRDTGKQGADKCQILSTCKINQTTESLFYPLRISFFSSWLCIRKTRECFEPNRDSAFRQTYFEQNESSPFALFSQTFHLHLLLAWNMPMVEGVHAHKKQLAFEWGNTEWLQATLIVPYLHHLNFDDSLTGTYEEDNVVSLSLPQKSQPYTHTHTFYYKMWLDQHSLYI